MIQLSGLLWPVHLKPREDELLSSWLMRLTRAYSSVPHSFTRLLWPGLQIWNRDLDRLAPTVVVRDLAQHTGVSIQRAFGTTLKAYEGVVFEHLVTNSVAQWILPLQIWHRLHLRHGQQYCPRCLSEDEPYFRRRWRLSFVTGCTRHGLALLDRCVVCGATVNFHRAAYWIPRLSSCFKCGADLATAVASSLMLDRHELRAQKHLQYTIVRGYLEMQDLGPVYSHLYLAGYRALSRVLLSPRGPGALAALTDGHDLPKVDFTNPAEDNIDFAPIELRRHVMLAAWKLLHDWPEGFAESCRRFGIRGSDLRRDGPPLPYWMHRVLRLDIDKPNYVATTEEIQAAARVLSAGGSPVYPKAVYRTLGRATPKDLSRYYAALGLEAPGPWP
jgi:hypothetical protein